MAPLPTPHTPRLILYHQTHHTPSGDTVPLLPLISTPLTHLILAAVHLNGPPSAPFLTLNDDPPSAPRNTILFSELAALQLAGIKVMAMLGGAAQGSFRVLDGSPADFETYYALVHDLIASRRLDGIDLDVEEQMSLTGVVRLIDRLRADFGPRFIITLAPVAPALVSRDPRANLSGFDYRGLEGARGREVAWYNAQFYCGWGDVSVPTGYLGMLAAGWDMKRVVMGVVTCQANGSGFVDMGRLAETVLGIKEVLADGWGGVMGWEYFNAEPGGKEKPWEWAEMLGGLLGSMREAAEDKGGPGKVDGVEESTAAIGKKKEDGQNVDNEGEATEKPTEFEYFTDSSDS